MSKHLTNKEIDNRLGAVMNAFKEENATSVLNMNCVASMLRSGTYSINGDAKTNQQVADSISRLTSFVNRISDIVHKGTEECDLDTQIDANRKFWKDLEVILNS
jgi:hypothetical protein